MLPALASVGPSALMSQSGHTSTDCAAISMSPPRAAADSPSLRALATESTNGAPRPALASILLSSRKTTPDVEDVASKNERPSGVCSSTTAAPMVMLPPRPSSAVAVIRLSPESSSSSTTSSAMSPSANWSEASPGPSPSGTSAPCRAETLTSLPPESCTRSARMRIVPAGWLPTTLEAMLPPSETRSSPVTRVTSPATPSKFSELRLAIWEPSSSNPRPASSIREAADREMSPTPRAEPGPTKASISAPSSTRMRGASRRIAPGPGVSDRA